MAYIIKDIADITVEPKMYSLANTANYIEFSSKVQNNSNDLGVVRLSIGHSRESMPQYTNFTIKESTSGIEHSFKGTREINSVNNSTYFINDDDSITASNIANCLKNNSFLSSHYFIDNPIMVEDETAKSMDVVILTSNGYVSDSSFEVIDYNRFFMNVVVDKNPKDNDTISMGVACEIELDIFKNPNRDNTTEVEPRATTGIQTIGEYIGSLKKNYFGVPIWFDLNSMMSYQDVKTTSFLYSDEWVINDTVSSFRFVAKRNTAINHEVFYYSDILFSFYGYTRGLDDVNMDDYIYSIDKANVIRLLTKQPSLFYSKGQKQYLNFLFNNDSKVDAVFGVKYVLYTQSGKTITEFDDKLIDKDLLGVSNTIELGLDSVIEDYPKTGRIEAYLIVNDEIKSEPLSFIVMPACLITVRDFVFLNSLGGWSCLNFGGTFSSEFKPTAETFYKTKTPHTNISSSINAVYKKETSETYTATSDPLTYEMCEYFREIATSKYVYEIATKRYVIVDDMTIKSNTKDELFTIEMKYKYSDTYNGL